MATKASKDSTFSDVERNAMKEAAAERRKAAKKMTPAEQEAEVVSKISQMAPADREIGEKLHTLVKKIAPELQAKTWYGMPAYNKDGKSILFFQDAGKFKVRYSTVGFNEHAKLDDGAFWPTSFAILKWNAAIEKELSALIKKAIS